MDIDLREQPQDGSHVDAGRLEELLGDRAPGARQLGVGAECEHVEDDAAGEREAVGMDPRGRDAQHDVAGPDGAAVDDAARLHDPDREADEVVLTPGVEVGHLRDLTAHQRAAGPAAALRHARDDALDPRGVDAAGADVVEEVERLRAVHEDVVHAHRDEVDTDRVVAVGTEGDLQLAADAVGRRDEHRLAITPGDPDERREGADPAEDFRPVGAARVRGEPPHGLVAGLDVDPGVAVRERLHVGRA